MGRERYTVIQTGTQSDLILLQLSELLSKCQVNQNILIICLIKQLEENVVQLHQLL